MSNDPQDAVVLRDLIYLDVAKMESILSQIEGGLVSEVETSSDEKTEKRNIRQYDFKLFKPEFGGTQTENETTIKRRRRHHEMYNLLERFVLSEGLGMDLNNYADPDDNLSEEIHRDLAHYGFLKATGWVSVEDYTRLQYILREFNSLLEFVNRSQVDNLPELLTLKTQIEAKKQEVKEISDRNRKSRAKRELDELQSKLRKQEESLLGQNQLQEWYVQGIDELIETFLKDRLNLFVYPFENNLSFHIISPLKRTCLVDTDTDSFIYSFGNRPNLKLTIFGLITSLPMRDSDTPNFTGKYDDLGTTLDTERLVLEKAFAKVFDALQAVESYFSFSHFPNITLYPIAIFREINNLAPNKRA